MPGTCQSSESKTRREHEGEILEHASADTEVQRRYEKSMLEKQDKQIQLMDIDKGTIEMTTTGVLVILGFILLANVGFSVFLTILAIGFALLVLWFGISQLNNNASASQAKREIQEQLQVDIAKLRKCPSCGHPDSKSIHEETLFYETTQTKTRKHTHYDTDGHETGYTETEYEVPDKSYYTRYTRKCDSCGHEWSLSSLNNGVSLDQFLRINGVSL